jgi:YbbR domain-containing protein
LNELRKNPISREQVRTFSYVLRAIALGRLPGEQALSRKAVFSRLLAALVMSAALWYYITDQENPVVRSQPFTLQVVPQHVPKQLAIRSGLTSVTVTARGLQDAVNGPQQLTPYVDLSDVSPTAREVTVPIQLSGKKPDLQYTISPATLSLQLEPLVTNSIPVIFNPQSSLPISLVEEGQSITPNVLTVSGPADEVQQIYQAVVSAPLSTVAPPNAETSNFSTSFTLVPDLVDKNGHPISTGTFLAANTTVRVTLLLGVSFQVRTITIAPIVVGGPPFGYELDQLQPEPLTVTVLGPPDEVNSVKAISTDPINLQGITQSMTLTTHLDINSLPPNVILYYPNRPSSNNTTQTSPVWKVQVSISMTQVSDLLPASVAVDNVSPFLQAIPSVKFLHVYVSGPYVAIMKLGPLVVHLNLANKRQGVYTFHPTLSLPGGIAASISPTTIKVLLTP